MGKVDFLYHNNVHSKIYNSDSAGFKKKPQPLLIPWNFPDLKKKKKTMGVG